MLKVTAEWAFVNSLGSDPHGSAVQPMNAS